MIIGLFVLFQIIALIMFGVSFYTKNEIVWGITLVLFGVLMFTSYHIEIPAYEYNSTIEAYEPVMQSYSYPYLMGINILFFGLSILFAFFDIFEKLRASKE